MTLFLNELELIFFTHLNYFKYCNLTEIVLFDISYLFPQNLNVFKFCYLTALNTSASTFFPPLIWKGSVNRLLLEQFEDYSEAKNIVAMAWALIWSGLSDPSLSLTWAKPNCFKSRDHFGYLIKNCSVTKIPFSTITDRNPQLSNCLNGAGLTLLQSYSLRIQQPCTKELWLYEIRLD